MPGTLVGYLKKKNFRCPTKLALGQKRRCLGVLHHRWITLRDVTSQRLNLAFRAMASSILLSLTFSDPAKVLPRPLPEQPELSQKVMDRENLMPPTGFLLTYAASRLRTAANICASRPLEVRRSPWWMDNMERELVCLPLQSPTHVQSDDI